jgi:hypothetical protein
LVSGFAAVAVQKNIRDLAAIDGPAAASSTLKSRFAPKQDA